MTRKEAHKECLSRDCSCVLGKDRDSNYHEIIDKIYDDFEKMKDSINQIGLCEVCNNINDKKKGR